MTFKSSAIDRAEGLRTPDTVHEPDPRTHFFGEQPPSLGWHHKEVADIVLSPHVPEDVAIQFETAKNLYLYAWHVYRFFMVAQMQAMATLEFGLKKQFGRLPEPYQRAKQKRPMLAGLLRYAVDNGLIRNEGFRRWHEAAEHKARQRRHMTALQIMIDQQLDCIKVNDDEPLTVLPEDQQWDLVSVLVDALPCTRNELAHGSTVLTRQVRGDIELVAEILNQIYDPKCGEANSVAPPSARDMGKG